MGVCAHEMGDVQLALWVAHLLQSPSHPSLVLNVLQEQLQSRASHVGC